MPQCHGLLTWQVHPSDVASVALTYGGFKPKQFPATPGGEGVGTVEQSGPGAGRYPKGTRVIAVPWGTMGGEGTWQQYVAVPEAALVSVPDGVPDETAAQAIVNPGVPHACVCRACVHGELKHQQVHALYLPLPSHEQTLESMRACSVKRAWTRPEEASTPIKWGLKLPMMPLCAQRRRTASWRRCRSRRASTCCRARPAACWGASSSRWRGTAASGPSTWSGGRSRSRSCWLRGECRNFNTPGILEVHRIHLAAKVPVNALFVAPVSPRGAALWKDGHAMW